MKYETATPAAVVLCKYEMADPSHEYGCFDVKSCCAEFPSLIRSIGYINRKTMPVYCLNCARGSDCFRKIKNCCLQNFEKELVHDEQQALLGMQKAV